MSRRTKTMLITLAALAVIIVAGNIAFQKLDERRAAAFGFAVNEPEQALKQIARAAEIKGSLSGAGFGIAIAGKELPALGLTQWTISTDGVIRGTAAERSLIVLLTPELRDGRVAWNCKLEPEREFLRGTCAYVGQANR